MEKIEGAQAEIIVRGIATAVGADGGLSTTQAAVLHTVGTHLLDVDADPSALDPIGPEDLADALPDEALRRRVVHGMTALEILAQPVSPVVTEQVAAYAQALHIDEAMLEVARDYSQGAMDIAVQDWVRNSYPIAYYSDHGDEPTLHRTVQATGATSGEDPALAELWRTLEGKPSGSLGRTVWDFYQMRGFSVPGTPGAVDALLAQHDWVHCMADYGTSATGEIEVFTFVASAIPDQKGFSYAVVILGLFETGYVPMVPGVATADPGHLSKPGGPERLVDAVQRGMRLDLDVMGGVDWFAYADRPIDDVRHELGFIPKGADALKAGSLGALDPNAIFHHDAS